MISTDIYVTVPRGTDITFSVESADGHAEIVIGSSIGHTSAVRLLISDPDVFSALAANVTAAHEGFVRDVLEELDKQRKARLGSTDDDSLRARD